MTAEELIRAYVHACQKCDEGYQTYLSAKGEGEEFAHKAYLEAGREEEQLFQEMKKYVESENDMGRLA